MKKSILVSFGSALFFLIAVFAYADMKIEPNRVVFNDGSSLSSAGGGGGASSLDDLSDAKVKDGSFYVGTDSGKNESADTHFNVGFGEAALEQNTTGHGNTAIGSLAIRYNKTGQHNTAVGMGSLWLTQGGSNNTAIGWYSGRNNSFGNDNVCVGCETNLLNESGINNTIIGSYAGGGPLDGPEHTKSGNVFIGYKAGYNETGDNKLYIENSDSPDPLIGGDFSGDFVDINGFLNVKLPTGIQYIRRFPPSFPDTFS